MSDRDDLKAELAAAKQQGRGTDVARIKKQLAAFDASQPAEPAAPEPAPEKATAAASRAAVTEKPEPPKARTSPRGRASST